MRIQEHPILDIPKINRYVTIYVNGKPVQAIEGETIASALLAADIRVFRKTPKLHKPRGIFCAIGRCTDCALTVNGVANVRSCVTKVQDGMIVEIQNGLGRWE